MCTTIRIVLAMVREAFLSRAALHLENLALRQQLAALDRKGARPSLRMADRLFWVVLSRLWSGWREILVIVKPETVIGWHRKGFQVHKGRNIIERLPLHLHASVKKALRQAWDQDDADKAERLLRNLARRLEHEEPGVRAASWRGWTRSSPTACRTNSGARSPAPTSSRTRSHGAPGHPQRQTCQGLSTPILRNALQEHLRKAQGSCPTNFNRDRGIVKPETVIGWHRKGFRRFWTRKSRRGKPGRPPVSSEFRGLIRRMSRENPLWGAPRIHGELRMLGFEVSEAAVSKYMPRHPKPPSQTWRTFLENHVGCLASTDFFVVPTATFSLLFVLVVLRHERRRIVHIGTTAHPTAAWVAQQIREAFPWETAPRYMIRDRDRVYGIAFRSRIKAMGIEEVVTAPRSPWQSPYVERVIGSIRRECLDHVIVLNERHLRAILLSYIDYYQRSRTHLALGKDTPERRSVQPAGAGKIVAFPQVGGLHHRYQRLAA